MWEEKRSTDISPGEHKCQMVGHADTLSITETRERKEFWSSKTRDGKLKPGFKVAVRQSECRVRASKCHSEEGSKEAEARSGTIEFTCNSPSTCRAFHARAV